MHIMIESEFGRMTAKIRTPQFESFIESIQWDGEPELILPNDRLPGIKDELARMILPGELSQFESRKIPIFEAGIMVENLGLIATIPRNEKMIYDTISDEFFVKKQDEPGESHSIYWIPKNNEFSLLELSSMVRKGILHQAIFTGWAAEGTNFYTPLIIQQIHYTEREQQIMNWVVRSASERVQRWQNGER